MILLIGPGGYAFGKKEVAAAERALLNQGAKNFLRIGNGKDPLTQDNIKSLQSYIACASKNITLIIYAHGSMIDGRHKTKLMGCGKLTTDSDSIDFMQQIASTAGDRNVDIFSTSCHGGALHDFFVRKMPKTYQYVALTQRDETINGKYINSLWDMLNSAEHKGKKILTAEALLAAYLTKLTTRFYPTIHTSSFSSANLDDDFIKNLGTPFHKEKEANINRQLTQLGVNNNLLLKLMADISTGAYVEAARYGIALAICLANRKNLDLEMPIITTMPHAEDIPKIIPPSALTFAAPAPAQTDTLALQLL